MSAAILLGLAGASAVALAGPVAPILALLLLSLPLLVLFCGHRIFWAYLASLLLGYQFLGKGFAYVGVEPLYVAELGLALAGLTSVVMLLRNKLQDLNRFLRPEILLLTLFVAWQAARTLPYVASYGVDALRDAVLWGYAAFALFILLLVPRHSVERIFGLYGKVLPIYLAWLPIAWALHKGDLIDFTFPGAPVPLLYLKAGDTGVHLAGAAAFMLLRPDLLPQRFPNAMLWCCWGLWGLDWVAYGTINRGGMLSALLGMALIVLWLPKTRWYRPLLLAIVLIGLLSATEFKAPFSKDDTAVATQLTENARSIFGEGSGENLEGTETWRLQWWEQIVEYTLRGDYFWTGKGYGINLAEDDGFSITSKEEDQTALRSPHNASMTILARSGAPGLALWALFLTSFGLLLIREASSGRGGEVSRRQRITLCLLAYWVAFLCNSSFDVFLEGPMGGVWFWSLIGMTLVYLPRGRESSRAPRAIPPGAAQDR